ncbi:MAG: GNAT family N-acetyltransferase [Proteobacteria bacterium]|nr:GNAT family N-acetyltransferase [Pseudomonadota bacterium]
MTPDFVRQCVSAPAHETFLYTGEARCDKVLGILSVSRDDRIVLCHVDPKSFRKGIGTALWRTYLKACTPTLTHVDAPLPSVNWFLGKGFTLDAATFLLH